MIKNILKDLEISSVEITEFSTITINDQEYRI